MLRYIGEETPVETSNSIVFWQVVQFFAGAFAVFLGGLLVFLMSGPL